MCHTVTPILILIEVIKTHDKQGVKITKALKSTVDIKRNADFIFVFL